MSTSTLPELLLQRSAASPKAADKRRKMIAYAFILDDSTSYLNATVREIYCALTPYPPTLPEAVREWRKTTKPLGRTPRGLLFDALDVRRFIGRHCSKPIVWAILKAEEEGRAIPNFPGSWLTLVRCRDHWRFRDAVVNLILAAHERLKVPRRVSDDMEHDALFSDDDAIDVPDEQARLLALERLAI